MNSSTSASASSPPISTSQLRAELHRLLTLKKERRDTNRLALYRPYPKQAAFHAAGAMHRERLFMAGNQFGKTLAGAYEIAMHLTGHYPEWWTGRRFDRPVRMWAAGQTAESTRDSVQKLLVGPPEREDEWGTGAIPKVAIVDTFPSRGVANALDSVTARHVAGGISTLLFKSYIKGREKWQADTLDAVWFDEEPPQDIYTEGLTRTNATGGLVFMTFTPLLGMSEVVRRFLMEPSVSRHVTRMTIDDAEHIPAEKRAEIIASYPPHEREARTKGEPQLGSGRIFPVEEAALAIEPFEIPRHWPRIAGLDFGWDHPTAAVELAWDREPDVLYVTKAYRAREAVPAMHAATLRPWGTWLPVAWPHDGLQHDKGSGDQLATLYRDQGLNMLQERATFEDGTNGLEAGLFEMLERMQTGRWKVFRHLSDWFEEFRLYHRKDGKVVKLGEDLMSASRYAMMMRREAVTAPGRVVPVETGHAHEHSWLGA